MVTIVDGPTSCGGRQSKIYADGVSVAEIIVRGPAVDEYNLTKALAGLLQALGCLNDGVDSVVFVVNNNINNAQWARRLV